MTYSVLFQHWFHVVRLHTNLKTTLKRSWNVCWEQGYRKKHSTLTILIKLRDNIECAMKSREVTLAAFVDFSKAFDTIVNVLIHKLHIHYIFMEPNLSHFELFAKQKPFCPNRFTLFKLFILKVSSTIRVDLRASII